MDSFQIAYESFCDDLWRDWLADRVAPSAFISKAIERDFAPEPWLEFRAGSHQLVVLTTNPGGGMTHQNRDRILNDKSSVIKPADSYRAATTALAPFYMTDPELAGSAAQRRIHAFLRLAELAKYDGVLQVESYPFHSARFPKKSKDALLLTLKTANVLRQYCDHLHHFLKPRPVVVVSAVSSRTALNLDATDVTRSPWLTWKAGFAGLVLKRAEFKGLVKKGPKVTCAASVSFTDGIPKAIVLMMGGNHLPSDTGLRILAQALQRRAG